MRLWSIHPRYLDSKGLTALWRESLLARSVLEGRTKGYRSHPQLIRFRQSPDPICAINCYLAEVHREACRRGYCFSGGKLREHKPVIKIAVTGGQLLFELGHLKRKLKSRDPPGYRKLLRVKKPQTHPLFRRVKGPRESWERGV